MKTNNKFKNDILAVLENYGYPCKYSTDIVIRLKEGDVPVVEMETYVTDELGTYASASIE